MAEILYDEAPGVSRIRFATADGGPAAKANAIDALVADGARVIADDTSYVTEPFFQDDVIAQAVDRAKAAGVAYFIAAGNDAQHGWGAAFSPVADPSPAHSPGTEDFDPGPVVDTTQTIGTFSADESVDLVLQWAEPWGGGDIRLRARRVRGRRRDAHAAGTSTRTTWRRAPHGDGRRSSSRARRHDRGGDPARIRRGRSAAQARRVHQWRGQRRHRAPRQTAVRSTPTPRPRWAR